MSTFTCTFPFHESFYSLDNLLAWIVSHYSLFWFWLCCSYLYTSVLYPSREIIYAVNSILYFVCYKLLLEGCFHCSVLHDFTLMHGRALSSNPLDRWSPSSMDQLAMVGLISYGFLLPCWFACQSEVMCSIMIVKHQQRYIAPYEEQ